MGSMKENGQLRVYIYIYIIYIYILKLHGMELDNLEVETVKRVP